MAKKSAMTVRQFHALGRRVLKAAARRKRRGEGVWGLFDDEFDAKAASERNRLQESRRFARLYSRQQLNRLCKLGRDVGRPLSRLHVLQLIRVADRRQRNSLAIRCAQQKWSVRKLEFAVRLIKRRTYGGANPTVPESIEESLIVTEKMARGLARWVNAVITAAEDSEKERSTFGTLSKRMRKRLVAISKEAELLFSAIERQLGQTAKKPRTKSRAKRK